MNVSFSQISVFRSDLQEPFNDWTDEHVAQGFAWRPESVSFKTIEESGKCLVKVILTDKFDPIETNVIRAIEVPFTVPAHGEVDIASIEDSMPISLPAGDYCLRCEFSRKTDGCFQVCLIFSQSDMPRFSQIKCDDEIENVPENMLMIMAEPALT